MIISDAVEKCPASANKVLGEFAKGSLAAESASIMLLYETEAVLIVMAKAKIHSKITQIQKVIFAIPA